MWTLPQYRPLRLLGKTARRRANRESTQGRPESGTAQRIGFSRAGSNKIARWTRASAPPRVPAPPPAASPVRQQARDHPTGRRPSGPSRHSAQKCAARRRHTTAPLQPRRAGSAAPVAQSRPARLQLDARHTGRRADSRAGREKVRYPLATHHAGQSTSQSAARSQDRGRRRRCHHSH